MSKKFGKFTLPVPFDFDDAFSTQELLKKICNVINAIINKLQIIVDAIESKQDKTDNNLETSSKQVVGAINELNTKIPTKQDITDNTLTTTNKQIVSAINELNTKANNKQNKTDNNLETSSKQVVGAINELNSVKLDSASFQVVNALPTTSEDNTFYFVRETPITNKKKEG